VERSQEHYPTTAKRDPFRVVAELGRGSFLSQLRACHYCDYSRTSAATDSQLLGSIAPTAHALNTTLSKAALERKLTAAETTRLELEALLRKRNTIIEHLEADRRWPAQREQEEREDRERLLKECKEEKLSRKN